MMYPLLVWLGSALLVFAVLVGLRRVSLRRSGRLRDFHWKGMIGLAVALGALPAIVAAALPGHRTPLPDTTLVDDVLRKLDKSR